MYWATFGETIVATFGKNKSPKSGLVVIPTGIFALKDFPGHFAMWMWLQLQPFVLKKFPTMTSASSPAHGRKENVRLKIWPGITTAHIFGTLRLYIEETKVQNLSLTFQDWMGTKYFLLEILRFSTAKTWMGTKNVASFVVSFGKVCLSEEQAPSPRLNLPKCICKSMVSHHSHSRHPNCRQIHGICLGFFNRMHLKIRRNQN